MVVAGMTARTGVLRRVEDETGLSGTGDVAWIVEFPDGVCVTRWCVTDIRQTCVWASLDDVLAVHGHDGKTRIVWHDFAASLAELKERGVTVEQWAYATGNESLLA